MRKLPDRIDLKALAEFKKNNFKERLGFVKIYAEKIKKTSNKKWSSEQKNIICNS